MDLDSGERPGDGGYGSTSKPNPLPYTASDDSYRGLDMSSDGANLRVGRSHNNSNEPSTSRELDRGVPTPIHIDNTETDPELMNVDIPSGTTQYVFAPERPMPPRPALHSVFNKVCTKNAKCDQCEKRNTSVMQKCQTCGMTTCKSCYEIGRYDNRHNLGGITLDWEPLLRDKRGRIMGTQPIRGVAKGKRGRPPHPPGASKAGRGLVRELGSHAFEEPLSTASAAILPEIVVASTSDVSLTLPTIVHVEDRSPTPQELGDCASSHHGMSHHLDTCIRVIPEADPFGTGSDRVEEADMIHARGLRVADQDCIYSESPGQQGTLRFELFQHTR